jgi:U4/U6 small nuclear ribonucleoprotein PRP4
VEGKRRARTVVVPTSDTAVRRRLRELNEPITLFGEGPPQRRERLREVLAMRAVQSATTDTEKKEVLESLKAGQKEEADFANGGSKANGPFAVPGSDLLKQRRLEILNYSLPRASARIAAQKIKSERSETVEQLNTRHSVMVARLSVCIHLVTSYDADSVWHDSISHAS